MEHDLDKTSGRPSMFVLDTNVLLYDHNCIDNFQEHDVVIPITVLEELDEFKKGNDLINFQAREFIRKLDRLSGDRLFDEGLPLGSGRGKLFVKIASATNVSGVDSSFFSMNKPDHRILALADQLRTANSDRSVILISKDINLRMKAKSLGIQAEDYETGKVENVDELYTGTGIIETVDKDLISRFYQQPFSVPRADVDPGLSPVPNQFFILRNGSSSSLTWYNPETDEFERIIKTRAYGIQPRNAEQTFALHTLLNPAVRLVTLTGKAGTGKTLLALAAALEQRSDYRQIYLARPVVPLGNRDLGFLPGDVQSKLDPYMQPLWDNLGVIRNRFSVDSREFSGIQEMIELEKLFIAPLAYIRGRSLDSIYFIVDEAQNLTPHEIKTIITRAGEGTKMVFTGDIYQIDTPYLDSQSNGLTFLVDRMKDERISAHINLVKGERSELAELASNLL
ncbi:MAG: phosphate starvation-inducible protein PhoH [Candidatus Aegiribacteria sp. MLS_C]|nr:MAG: phosphate starvation-inducible protein PhoH [Candidatus Aegiribacteria sp. MLS_C]